MTRILLIILLFCCCSKDKTQEVVSTKTMNFYGCNRAKSGNVNALSNCVVRYEVLPNKYLKIMRQGENLNCGTDSITLSLSCHSNYVIIKETSHLDNAAFCNCNMNYEYIIGPMELTQYEIEISSAAGKSYSFNVKMYQENIKSTCE